MEAIPEISEKAERIGLWGPVFALKTANSACSVGFYARISGIREYPLKYTDPDGKEIYTLNEEVVRDINYHSYHQYAFDENKKMYKTEKTNELGSKLYSELIDRALSSESRTIIIDFAGFTDYTGKLESINRVYGGGATIADIISDTKEYDPDSGNPILVFVSGNSSFKDSYGESIRADRSEVLLHELVVHAIPLAVNQQPRPEGRSVLFSRGG